MKKRPSGTTVALGLGVVAVVFGATLWWFQTQAFYEEIAGLETVEVAGQALPVSGYTGIDAASSPLKLRACFRQDWALDLPPAEEPTPLVAPGWFRCFDAESLTADLAAGRATAYVAAADQPEGFDRLVAVYPDGRGFMWRQLNEKFRD